jgi:hypothetical protein
MAEHPDHLGCAIHFSRLEIERSWSRVGVGVTRVSHAGKRDLFGFHGFVIDLRFAEGILVQ